MKLIELFESKELKQLQYSPLSNTVAVLLNNFYINFKLIENFMQKELSKHDLEDLLQSFGSSKFNCLKEVIEPLNEILHTVNNKSTLQISSILDSVKSAKEAFLKSDKKAFLAHKSVIKDHLNKIDVKRIDLNKEVKIILKRYFFTETTIFGSTRSMENLSIADYKALNLDFSKPLYSPAEFDMTKTDDFFYVVFFLQHLKTDSKPTRITSEYDLRQFNKVLLKDKNFKRLISVLERYLSNNNKKLIPEIITLINAIPDIRAINNKRKQEIKQVYRGLNLSADISQEEIEHQDLQNKFVATSTSRRAAINFAHGRGHLESSDTSRSENPVLLVYETTPESIVFDTQVLDTIFNESEILIDTTKAHLKEIIEL